MTLNTKQLLSIAKYILSTHYQIGENESVDDLLRNVTHKAHLIAEAGREYTANQKPDLDIERVRDAIDLIEILDD